MVLDLKTVNRSHVARETGCDMAHISRIFGKKARPSLELALAIAAALGVSVEDLCEALGIQSYNLKKEEQDG